MSDVVCILPAKAGIDRSAQGLLGAGRRLADSGGGKLRAVLLGAADDDVARGAAAVADSVAVADHPLLAEYHPETTLSALATVCKELAPRAVLLGNDAYSQELAPRLAHRLGGSAGGDAVDIKLEGDQLRIRRGVYGGKATAVISLLRSPGVVWARARALEPADAAGRAPGEIQRLALDLKPDERVKLVSRHVEAKEGVRLEEARLIVSGGRGLGGPEPFKELQALAEAMGAQMAASRAACDAGWVPASLASRSDRQESRARAVPGDRHFRRQPAHHGHRRRQDDLRHQSRRRRPHLQALPIRHRRRLPESRRTPARAGWRNCNERAASRSNTPGLLEHQPRLADVRAARADRGRGRIRRSIAACAPGGADRPENRFDRPLERIALLAKHGLLQLRTWRKAYPGTMHAMIFWGFIVLTIATTVVMLDYDFGIPIMRGRFYLYFQSLFVDIFGGLAMVGIGMAAARRWLVRPRAARLHLGILGHPGRDLRDPGDRLSGRRLADRGHRRSLGRLVAVGQCWWPPSRGRLMSVDALEDRARHALVDRTCCWSSASSPGPLTPRWPTC